MVAGVSVGFGLVKDEVSPALDKQNQKLKLGKRLISEATVGYKTYERDAIRALKATSSETDRVAKVQRLLNKLVAEGHITQERADRAAGAAVDQIHRKSRLAANIASSVRSTLTGYLGIHAAIGVANRLLQDQIEIQNKLSRRSLSLGDAQRQLINNLDFGASIEDQKEFVDFVAGPLAKELNINRVTLTQAATKVFSATSGAFGPRREQTEATLRSIAPFFRGREDDLGVFGGIIEDAARTFSREGVGLTREQTTALLLQAQSQLRITDIANLKNLIPAIVSADVTSDAPALEDAKLAIATFGAAGGRGGEGFGERTGTAISLLAAVLKEELPQFKTFSARLAAVQADERLQRKVIPELRGKSGTKDIVEELVRAGVTAEAAQGIFDNLDIDVERLRQQREFIDTGTVGLRQRTDLERSLIAAEDIAIRSGQARAGRARQVLFEGLEDRVPVFASSNAVDRLFKRTVFDILTGLGATDTAIDFVTRPSAEQPRDVREELILIRKTLELQNELERQTLENQKQPVDQTQAQPPEPGG